MSRTATLPFYVMSHAIREDEASKLIFTVPGAH